MQTRQFLPLFTLPLPYQNTLKHRLSGEVEWIELTSYGATLLRLTVFPQGPAEEEVS